MTHRLVIDHQSDGQVAVAFWRTGQALPEVSGQPIPFTSPLSDEDRQHLRWYLEDYLIAPYAVYEQRGQKVKECLPEWGKALFTSIFGPGTPGRDAYLRAREGQTELTIRSPSASFLSLPWELLQDPDRATPIALSLTAIDRTLAVQGATTPVPPSEDLRVLMVIARPAGLGDVGYQMIARPLVERLGAVSGNVDLDVLRPPTFEAFQQALAAAVDENRPYHIVHFDGHGTFGQAGAATGQNRFDSNSGRRGQLAFEAEGGGDHFVSADQFALAVNRGKVPLAVLNACQSGMLGETEVEAAVSTRLLEEGAASVVAMGYSVYAVAAAEFMAAFYEALFAGKPISDAVTAGRRRLYDNKNRPSPKGPLPLEDWIVPVHYLRSTIRFPSLKQTRPSGLGTLDDLLNEIGSTSTDASHNEQGDPLTPVGRFVGRDAAFYTLELALKWQRVVVVHGPAGTGKTELAKAFGRWWRVTGGVGQPEWVFFHSFEPGLASFGLDGVVTQIGLKLFGQDFIGRTRDAAQRQELLLKLLRERPMLLIWDNFESVREMPDPTGATPPLNTAEQSRMRDFLAALVSQGRSGVIITSRTPESWLGEIRRIELGGLTPGEAAEMAEDVLQPYPTGRQRRQERAFAELLDWLNGHPLSLRVLLPQLERVTAANLLEALKGNTASLPPGFVGDGRLQALGTSLKYSLDHLPTDMRERLPALALFEGVVDEDVLGIFSKMEGVPVRLAGITKEEWTATLRRLVGLGLLTLIGGGMYGLHPALPSYLMAEWRQKAGSGFEAEHAAAERGLLGAYAIFGDWLLKQMSSGLAQIAFKYVEGQRRTMGRLLDFALKDKLYANAQGLMQPLDEFWDMQALTLEARGWTDRCRAALEAKDGTPPDLNGPAGKLWLFTVGTQANRALAAGDLATAYKTYNTLRKKLEILSGTSAQSHLSTSYHLLGVVEQQRGNLDAAESWYLKSLEIYEEVGSRPGVAGTYHQLGTVEQRRGNLDAAESWYLKSLEIGEVGNRHNMANTYHQLGVVEQQRGNLDAAESWHLKSLEIYEEVGSRPDTADAYHQLGMVEQRRGNLDAAENWYHKGRNLQQ